MTATRPTSGKITVETIADWLRLFFEPGDVTELRAVRCQDNEKYRPHTEAGFFDYEHFDLMAETAMDLARISEGVYFTFNPLDPQIRFTVCNRVKHIFTESLSADTDVLCRRWLLVDADPVRRAGIPSTDAEKADAKKVARAVRDWLTERGWTRPIVADSANGWHLLYRIELPRDDAGLVERILKALAQKFDTPRVKIDTSVFNPSRITKLYGTTPHKGDHTKERPHRPSWIVEVP
jgi:hypothetical protein